MTSAFVFALTPIHVAVLKDNHYFTHLSFKKDDRSVVEVTPYDLSILKGLTVEDINREIKTFGLTAVKLSPPEIIDASFDKASADNRAMTRRGLGLGSITTGKETGLSFSKHSDGVVIGSKDCKIFFQFKADKKTIVFSYQSLQKFGIEHSVSLENDLAELDITVLFGQLINPSSETEVAHDILGRKVTVDLFLDKQQLERHKLLKESLSILSKQRTSMEIELASTKYTEEEVEKAIKTLEEDNFFQMEVKLTEVGELLKANAAINSIRLAFEELNKVFAREATLRANQ